MPAFQFHIIHVPGKKNAADATSRYPSSSMEDEDTADDAATVTSMCDTLYQVTHVTTWDMVRDATASDQTLKKLGTLIQEGFPEVRHLSPELRPYQRISDQLSIVDGVILAGNRLVIPAALRPNILTALHAAHQGV